MYRFAFMEPDEGARRERKGWTRNCAHIPVTNPVMKKRESEGETKGSHRMRRWSYPACCTITRGHTVSSLEQNKRLALLMEGAELTWDAHKSHRYRNEIAVTPEQ